MKIKCVIVDDEPLALQLLQKHLAQLDFFEIVATSNNALKALEILNRQPVDLLFLDIKMPQLSGLDFLKSLRNPPKTILTTAFREFALDGFELGVIDYLLKPITFDRFLRPLSVISAWVISRSPKYCLHPSLNLSTLKQVISSLKLIHGIFYMRRA